MSARAKTASIATRVGDLAGLDALEHEAVALFIPSDLRPLRGVAGFVDWRTNGALSRRLLDGTFEGKQGEVLLAPTTGRLGPRRFFLFGLGPRDGASREVLRAVCDEALRVCEGVGVRSIAFAAPAGLEERFISVASEAGPGRIEVILIPPGHA